MLEIAQSEDLAPLRVRPAQQRQMVDDGFGQMAFPPQRADREGSCGFRERPPLLVDDANREQLIAALVTFEAMLSCDGVVVDRGVGANVLGSPALALGHLARVVDADNRGAPLTAAEIVTTGTITDAWPIAADQTWTSDYGSLGLNALTLTLS